LGSHVYTPKVFAGPISESVPTSITGFAHRRSRANSTASFTYFQEREDYLGWLEDEPVTDEGDVDLENGKFPEEDFDEPASSSIRRKSSSYSRKSAEDPLLYRHDSARTDDGRLRMGNRITQKIYVLTEDLTIVVTGFRTKTIGYFLYILLCTLTLGFGFVILRWLPRWRVRLIGTTSPLRDCKWVVIEVGFPASYNGSIAATKILTE
jgi:cation-transporting ATPase 13A3/4/5